MDTFIETEAWKFGPNKETSPKGIIAADLTKSLDWSVLVKYCEEIRNAKCAVHELEKGCWAMGKLHMVVEVRFYDGVRWAAKIRIPPIPRYMELYGDLTGWIGMSRERDAMDFIRSKTSMPIPACHGQLLIPFQEEDPRFATLKNTSCLVTDYIPGRTADSLFSPLMERNGTEKSLQLLNEARTRVIWQVGDFVSELARHKAPQIGPLVRYPELVGEWFAGRDPELLSGPFDDEDEYYAAVAYYAQQDCFEEFKREQPHSLTLKETILLPAACLQLLRQLPKSTHQGEYVFANLDFGAHSAIIDDNNRIVAVIDCDNIYSVPHLVAAQPPARLGLDLQAEDQGVSSYNTKPKRPTAERTSLSRYARRMNMLEKAQGSYCEDQSVAKKVASDAAYVLWALEMYRSHDTSQNKHWYRVLRKIAKRHGIHLEHLQLFHSESAPHHFLGTPVVLR